MNYMREMNAFREWLLVNELPTSAVVLWYTLMSINNLARWKKRFNAPNRVVQQLTGLSIQGISNAREILIEHDLIVCQKGKKGQAPIYKMYSVVQKNEHIMEQAVESSHEDNLNIHRHRQDKTETKQKNTVPFMKHKQQNQGTKSSLPFQESTNLLFAELRKEADI